MSEVERFDAIIIGAGQSGGPLSGALGSAGQKTAIIERAYAGGNCINYGCTPTKTMIASARSAYLARRSEEFGVRSGAVTVDMPAVRDRKRRIVESFREGSRSAIESNPNVELIFGEASFVASKTLQVALNDGGTRLLAADTIIINSGTRPRIPPLVGIEDADPLTSVSIMELDELPRHLIVLGGGPVGLEFSQMFRRFGSEVTIIEHRDRLAPMEDYDICLTLADIFKEDGIEVITSAQATSLHRDQAGTVTLRLSINGDECAVSGDQILVAVGRVPNTDMLNLDIAGIATSKRGFITVDDRLETNVPGIYATGDINGGPQFTHISYDDFRILRENLVHGGNASRAGRMVPYVIYTDPELGRIGPTAEQARENGHDIIEFELPATGIARTIEAGESRGLLKAVADACTGQILGASILCTHGGEIAGAVQIAMMGNLPYTALRDAVFSHPTLMEGLNNLFSNPVPRED